MSETRTVRLPDGRTLACAQWGPSGGRPVLECHGNPGSRIPIWDEAALDRADVRLLTVDRPGIGRSTPSSGRAVVDWGDDVGALLDALGVERLGVLGYSVGGAYAAACAKALPERVSALALVSSIVPLDDGDAFSDKRRSPEWVLARHTPSLARAAIAVGRSLLRHRPGLVRAAFAATLSAPDRALLRADPALVERGIAMGLEATRQGGAGLVEDLRAVMRPWGFRLEDIDVPTTVWQGDRDGSIPFRWGARLAEAIPRATLHAVRGEGHLMLASHLEEIAIELARPSLARAPS